MRTVLIADDEDRVRRLVATTIMSDQFELLHAANGNAAWELIEEHRPELVLLDVSMPGRSGLELTEAIRADPALAGTHVILITAYGEPDQIAAGERAGADLYLVKPFSPLQLLAAIERALKIQV